MIALDEAFVERMKVDTAAAVTELCASVLAEVQKGSNWSANDYKILSQAYMFLEAAREANILASGSPVIAAVDMTNRKFMCAAIQTWLVELRSFYRAILDLNALDSSKNHFRSMFGSLFSYEFSQGDLEKVQLLVNELRERISSAALDDSHKRRLLVRLEKLQSELHKKVSDLDRFWGLIGDAGVVIGKLGDDAKPIVDRIREVADIVWRTQSRAEELPSGSEFPRLEDKSGE
ncbi:hypothetical protein [Ectopseudomonas alcaliphila]|uniref:Uncharacterized protein n=1 Tax=Ectopseudomonas alcaliphila TaxID=101564 RepID=A0A1G7E7X3_9GAMM|nr:hypothetical protein [Pseudomonas alcaliphila]MDX5990736.1 hypothetical protein [Pseudomonas alcaliphila]SDE59729.1 hypothetical protein SAMN05216575_103231 [Pseudomonas alcaliphila]